MASDLQLIFSYDCIALEKIQFWSIGDYLWSILLILHWKVVWPNIRPIFLPDIRQICLQDNIYQNRPDIRPIFLPCNGYSKGLISNATLYFTFMFTCEFLTLMVCQLYNHTDYRDVYLKTCSLVPRCSWFYHQSHLENMSGKRRSGCVSNTCTLP